MSFGNSVRGKRAPPPLPMYEPVVLKHVPTMVRRRYEHLDVDKLLDLNHDLNQDGPTNDGEDEEDEDLDPNYEDEDEFEDMGPGDISSEHRSAFDNDCDRSDVEHSECIGDTHVKVETQDNGLENPSKDQGLRESDNIDLQDSNPSSEVDCGDSIECQQSGEGDFTDNFDMGAYNGSVSNESIQPTDLQSEYSGSEDDESNVSNHAPIVESNLEDETLDNMLAELGNEQGDCKCEINGAGDVTTSSSSLKDETCGMEGNSVSGHENREIEDDATHDGHTAANHAPTLDLNLDEAETQHNKLAEVISEQGLLLNDSEGGYFEAEGINTSLSVNASVNGENEEKGHASFTNEQKTLPQMENDDLGLENLIRNRSFHLKGLKTEGDGNDIINGVTDNDSTVNTELQGEAHRFSNNEEDFDPEAFTKKVEDDGYELCCPYCKNCITNTLIYHRRGNNQHCRTTCFTGLLGLFCCIRD